jgi:hypothetical protein
MNNVKPGLPRYLELLRQFKEPLPTETHELIVELSKRVLRALPYFILTRVVSADRTLEIAIEDPHVNAFHVLENGERVLYFQMVLGTPGYRTLLAPGKEDVVIKALKIVMCHSMNNKKGLHLYTPPYPAPEIMTTEVVEGQSYPRRFINEAWINWMMDSAKNPTLLRAAALKLIGNKLFPGDMENKKLRMKGHLEFEIFELKNI